MVAQSTLSTCDILFAALEWSLNGPKSFQVDTDKGDTYFIGAIIALGASILSAANNIIMAKLGRNVPSSVQVGVFIIIPFRITAIA